MDRLLINMRYTHTVGITDEEIDTLLSTFPGFVCVLNNIVCLAVIL